MSRIVEMYANDDSIIEGIKKFEDAAVTRLYNKHKDYCVRFMNSKYDDEHTIQDIYQDAVIVFIENVRHKNLKLENTSIQTYLNSICNNQIKVRFGNQGKTVLVDDDSENQSKYNENINDWFNGVNDIKNERIKIIQEELLVIGEAGGKCYEILRLFYFEKRNMENIATVMNYTNADNAKNQKSRCLDRLKTQVLKRK